MLTPGSLLLGKFTVQRVLGQGGMGAVYLVRQNNLGGRPVAVKEMVVTITDAQQRAHAIKQFNAEAQMLAELDHPNLVRIIDYFEEAGNQYLVMDYVDGHTLDLVVNDVPGYLPSPVVVGWIDDVCDVLEYLHGRDRPIVVRDLKPSNIMLDARGRIRLIDFGIARNLADGTKTSTFIKGAGTAGFAPVEQYSGHSDNRTDIYSLGATMYALLTRTVPPVSVAMVTGEASLVPPSRLNPEVSAALEEVIQKMMALQKQDRYQTIYEARDALREAMVRCPVPLAENGLLNLHRNCSKCNTRALPLASLCVRCGHHLEVGAHGPAWPRPDQHGNVELAEHLKTDSGTLVSKRVCPQCNAPLVPLAKACFHCGYVIPVEHHHDAEVDTDQPAGAIDSPSSSMPSGARASVAVAAPAPSAVIAPAAAPASPPLPPNAPIVMPAPGAAPAAAPPRPAGSKAWIYVIILAVLGVVGYALTRPPPGPARGSVSFTFHPGRVELVVDGTSKGANLESGYRLELDAGPHTIQVRKDEFKPHKETINVKPNGQMDLTVRLERAVGTLQVESEPPGADVYVNEELMGKTEPMLLLNTMEPRQYDIEVRKSGYRAWKTKTEVRANEIATVHADLEPEGDEPPPDGQPSVRPRSF